jgi:predicted DsbA family dithiol-disulfide isomerase
MRIDIWSDVVCPWCWIGKHRLQRGLESLGADAPALEVRWHAYQLDPEAGDSPQPLRESLARRYGGLQRAQQMLADTQATARAEGLPMDFDRGQVTVSTLSAHRLLWLAAREGDAAAVGESLFHGYFAQGRDPSDPRTLVAAGAAGGLAEARVRALLDSDEGLAEVRAAIAQAQAIGIRAVPTFVIDGRYVLQGAQPPEAFAQVLRRQGAQAAPADAGSDDGCGPDGCPV